MSKAASVTSISDAPDQSHSPRLLYDRKGAARQLSISIRSLDYLIANKELTATRIGKKVMVPYTELKRYSRSNHYEPVLAPVAKKSA